MLALLFGMSFLTTSIALALQRAGTVVSNCIICVSQELALLVSVFEHVSKGSTGADIVGVRIPESDFIRDVCRQHSGAIALTSANLSGATSPLCVNDFAHLWPSCAAVFNGMQIHADRAGSTVVDLSQEGQFKIVRPGVSLADVRRCLLEQNLLEQT